VDGLLERQQRQQLLETLSEVTHGALLSPPGEPARELLVAWGFPEPSVRLLDVGYIPDPAFIAWELARRGVLAGEVEGTGMLDPSWSGRVVGPWRSPRGRILTFFAWRPEAADKSERYVFGPGPRPAMPFHRVGVPSAQVGHVWVVEGLVDALLATCLGMGHVLGVGGPMSLLSTQTIRYLAGSGVRQLTLVPADDEQGRIGVQAVLETTDRLRLGTVDVSVVDPGMMAGARYLGDLVRERGSRALAEVEAWRMEGDVFRVVMVPWQ
jgi:hypothetical protein